jgi:hypothetical protein
MIPPVKSALAVGVVVMDPDPLIDGISKKLTGRFSEARKMFTNNILIWYCSKILAYFSDISPKSGARVDPHAVKVKVVTMMWSDFKYL